MASLLLPVARDFMVRTNKLTRHTEGDKVPVDRQGQNVPSRRALDARAPSLGLMGASGVIGYALAASVRFKPVALAVAAVVFLIVVGLCAFLLPQWNGSNKSLSRAVVVMVGLSVAIVIGGLIIHALR